MRKAQKNMEERMRQAQEQQAGYSTHHQEGDIIIQKGADKRKPGSVPDSDGEYVEFEEIKD